MATRQAFLGSALFDGERWHTHTALLVEAGQVVGLVPETDTGTAELTRLPGRIVPGFIDLQVNGGGGALFNLTPDVEAIRTITSAFAPFGTTLCLPTLITDTPERTDAALRAGIAAHKAGVPGFLGLHLEGPHLAVSRKGAHEPALIRPMDESDMARLIAARPHLPALLITVAAETVPPAQIARLTAAGIVVSIGHSDASFVQMRAAEAAGASMVTHLFNAQSQMSNREPGVVGAALDSGGLSAGLIADGIHVAPATMGVALRAKRGPGRIFLVTDAMSITGTDWTEFTLTGRTVYRRDGALRLADGTLAGADLTMIDAVRFVHETLGLPLEEALRMASLYPAEALGLEKTHGHLGPGARADFVVLDANLQPRGTWIGGVTCSRLIGPFLSGLFQL
jgi:N-acetylglucosamine-6-phosphate deacetylase